MSGPHEISVCVCTYRRPDLLRRLLQSLARQDTGGLFTFSLVVVDNDVSRSAEPVVRECAAESNVSLTYVVEPQQNIALARNRAIANAHGNYVAFIDDDEFAPTSWLLTLFCAAVEYRVDGVLGPVKPHFDEQPPDWVIKGRFHDRQTYPTGLVIDRGKGRTGNVLLKRHLFEGEPAPFRPEFRSGEDQDFFGRMIEKGHVFIWCHEAMVSEVVPPIRWRRSFMLRRALLCGATSLLHPTFGARDVAKSAIAVPAYGIRLPFALLMGHDKFMTLLVRLCDHAGRLLAVFGVHVVKEPYVTD